MVTTCSSPRYRSIVFKDSWLILLPQSGLAGVIKALGLPTDNMDLFSVGSAFRVKETGDCMEVIEYFGGNKKIVTFKYNEEFDYDRPGKKEL